MLKNHICAAAVEYTSFIISLQLQRPNASTSLHIAYRLLAPLSKSTHAVAGWAVRKCLCACDLHFSRLYIKSSFV